MSRCPASTRARPPDVRRTSTGHRSDVQSTATGERSPVALSNNVGV